MVTTEQIKELREKTGISIAQCKKALEDAGGDMDKALGFLKEKGEEIAAKKADRELGAGVVSAYIHGGTIGSLVQLASETDFVARNPEIKTLADDLAMQVAAMMPTDVSELLAQPFLKNPETTVEGVVKAAIQKFGERLEIVRFVRFDAADR